MAERIIVFRVSSWFLERINEYCKSEGISYRELFERAIDFLCQKYLVEGNNGETESDRGQDRGFDKGEVLSETLQDSPDAGEV
jgi:hypothetical protein